MITNSSLLSIIYFFKVYIDEHVLTHRPLDKMADILAEGNFKCIFFNENDRISIRISLKLVPMSLIDNKSALVQVMAWRQTGDKA